MLRIRSVNEVDRRAPADPISSRFARMVARSVLAVVVATTIAIPQAGLARPSVDRAAALGTVREADLPREGRQVLAAIHAGGPFVSKRDGIPFGNREGILPSRKRGYYAEYTVPTPGASNRGARRIIAGRGGSGDFRTSNEYYYTSDHYQSFRRIEQ